MRLVELITKLTMLVDRQKGEQPVLTVCANCGYLSTVEMIEEPTPTQTDPQHEVWLEGGESSHEANRSY